MGKVAQESGTLLLLLGLGSRTNLVEAASIVSTTSRPVASTNRAAVWS